MGNDTVQRIGQGNILMDIQTCISIYFIDDNTRNRFSGHRSDAPGWLTLSLPGLPLLSDFIHGMIMHHNNNSYDNIN